jgi:hypothetical protein
LTQTTNSASGGCGTRHLGERYAEELPDLLEVNGDLGCHLAGAERAVRERFRAPEAKLGDFLLAFGVESQCLRLGQGTACRIPQPA